MSKEIIRITKSTTQRLQEYSDLFSDENSLCSEINHVWGTYIEIVAVKCPWNATWKLTERQCKQYKTFYPNTALVSVTSMNMDELTAVITVEDYQYDIELPSNITVDLIDLHPAKLQPVHIHTWDITPFNDWLNRCRFFYLHLWYPWDETDSCSIQQWASEHLENRLDLYEAIFSLKYGRVISNLISSYIEEAYDLEEHFLADCDNYKLLVESHLRRSSIKEEINALENPSLREYMIEIIKDRLKMSENTFFALVLLENSLKDYSEFISNLGQEVKLFRSTQETMNACLKSSTVFLTDGNHFIPNIGNLADGGVIKGLGSEVNLTEGILNPIPFVFMEIFGQLEIESVKISRSHGVIFNVRSILTLKKCTISGNRSKFSRCIVIPDGGHLIINDCTLNQFENGIILCGNARAEIRNCIIKNCCCGIMIFNSGQLICENVTISDSDVGICCGKDISFSNIIFKNTSKDVQVDHKLDC